MTMTTSQETISDTARRDGEALSHAMQDWVGSIQKFVGSEPTLDSRMRYAHEVVDNYFHVLEQGLAIQRKFFQSWLTALSAAKPETAKKH
jgi:hypothetical protein